MTYICLYLDYLELLEPYDLTARGALLTALLRYARTGEVPEFQGPERYLWPFLQNQFDRDAKAYEMRCAQNRANGAKGGRPRKEPDPIRDSRTAPDPLFPKTEGFF